MRLAVHFVTRGRGGRGHLLSFGVIEGKESEGRGIQLPPLFVRFFKMLLDYVTHSNNNTKGITRRGLFRKEQKLECFLTVFKFGLFFSYFFFIYVYILGFSMQGGSSQDVPVALQCLEEMLKKRRKQVISCMYQNVTYKCFWDSLLAQ